MSTKPRKGQAPPQLNREQFHQRFRINFHDPAFGRVSDAIGQIEDIAWEAYHEGRKAPVTAKAGRGFADPKYDLSVEWKETRDKLLAAEKVQKDPKTKSRVLVICGSSRNDGTCPGEMSKTYRMAKIVGDVLRHQSIEVDLLDLSRVTSEYMLRIHPCKGCVSTAMPLCHWPCSCYPNHALNQVGDWMAEIYEKWVAAHGVILLTPVNWYHSSSSMKLMIDRLVCADGGNPDPTSTQGKTPELAKKIELKGWDYPQHLAGRVYGVVVHGDVAGTDVTRSALSDWMDWIGLIDAGHHSHLDRYIGYYEPYATSHGALDKDVEMQEEVRNVARAVANAVGLMRAGKLPQPGAKLKAARPK